MTQPKTQVSDMDHLVPDPETAPIVKKIFEMNLEKMDIREKYVHDFVEQAKTYIEMPTLTPEILRTFVREIKVYEKIKKYSRKEGNLVVIHYTFQLPQEMLFSTEKENVDNSKNVAS